MAKDLNAWSGTGRLCGDPELKYTQSGVAVAHVRIAVNRGREEDGQSADFINVTLWRNAAEFASTYLKKGAQVAIQGRLKQRSWQAQDGTKRVSTEIVANELNALGKKADGQGTTEDASPNEDTANSDPNDPFSDE